MNGTTIEEKLNNISAAAQRAVNSLRELNATLYSTKTAFEEFKEVENDVRLELFNRSEK